MPRIAQLTDALRGRGKVLASLGVAAAALAGTAGAVSTAAAAPVQHRPAAHHPQAARDVAVVRHVATAPSPAAAHPAAAPQQQAPAERYRIYDSVTPSAIPGNHHDIATYATGSYAVSPSQVAGRKVLWIDTNGSDPGAAVLDVEPGDATPQLAATWAQHRLTAQPNALACIYTMRSDWPAVQAAVATLPGWMQSHIRWWIADPTGVPHVVPGSQATQWYWGPNYDISTATTGL